jgi:hypothetical protein
LVLYLNMIDLIDDNDLIPENSEPESNSACYICGIFMRPGDDVVILKPISKDKDYRLALHRECYGYISRLKCW